MASVTIKPINRQKVSFGIRGTTSLITHKWSEKALKQMRDKGGGRKTKVRDKRDPEGEADAATYRTAGGEIGIPLTAFKKSLLSAAHKDLGIEKTLVSKSFFFLSDDPELVTPIEFDDAVVREDCVRVGQGSADLRYRPEFFGWKCTITAELDADLLTKEDLMTLVNRAGFGIGIGEWRPEKKGEHGRYELDPNVPFEISE